MKISNLAKYKNKIAKIILVIMLSFTVVGIVETASTTVISADASTKDEVEEQVGKGKLGLPAACGVLMLYVKQHLFNNAFKEELKFKDAEITAANEIWGLLGVIGVAFAVIYFIMDLNRAAFMAASNWTMQSLISPMLKFGACMFVIQYGATFVSNILGFGNWFTDSVAENVSGENAVLYDNEIEMIKDLGLGSALVFMIFCVVLFLLSQVVQIVFLYKAIVWKIEVIIRCGITPVVLGDVWEGKNSGAIRWLKKLAGCVMYGGLMILIIKIGTDLTFQNWDFNNPSGSMADGNTADQIAGGAWALIGALSSCFIIPIAELGALGAAKQACMEVWQ